MMRVSVSFLKPKESIEKTISEIDATTADYLHVDLMDGKFVSTCNFQSEQMLQVLKRSKKPLDIHFMAYDLIKYINDFSILKPEFITFQAEATSEIKQIIALIHEKGCKAGLAIKPETNITSIIPYLSIVDLVLVMSVEPGKGGQKFLESTFEKLKKLKELQKNFHFVINVDGGINNENITTLKEIGVDMVVSGSFITLSDHFEEKIQILK